MDLKTWVESERGRAFALAKAIDVPPSFISKLVSGDKGVPQNRAPDIERFTAGAVAVEELLPDLTWLRIPDASWPHPSGRPLLDVASTDTRNAAQAQGVAANA